jgi:hypothetical protein
MTDRNIDRRAVMLGAAAAAAAMPLPADARPAAAAASEYWQGKHLEDLTEAEIVAIEEWWQSPAEPFQPFPVQELSVRQCCCSEDIALARGSLLYYWDMKRAFRDRRAEPVFDAEELARRKRELLAEI